MVSKDTVKAIIEWFLKLHKLHVCYSFMWFLFRVKFGEHNRCDQTQSAETRRVVKIIAHSFSLSDLSNDIALLRLNKPVEYNHAIRPVCLPKNDGKCMKREYAWIHSMILRTTMLLFRT